MRPLHAIVLATLAAAGCDAGSSDVDGDSDPTQPETCTNTGVYVDVGPEVVCADPSARDAARYERSAVSGQPTLSEALLTSAGIVVADFTGDGVLDTFLPHVVQPQLWIGQADGPPSDEAATRLAGITFTGSVGGTAADVDGDGDLDLLVTRFEVPILLLRNDGHGNFADVTALAGLDKYAWRSQSSSWADMDRDGDLDLFVGSYGPKPELAFDSPDIPPSEDDSQLWLNNGDGTFTDASALLPPEVQEAWTFMSSWIDLDTDGYPELFTWHDFGTSHPSVVLKNEGGTALVPILNATQIDAPFEDMGIALTDLHDATHAADGLPDFATTSYQKTRLIVSQATTTNPTGVLWVESSSSRGLAVDVQDRNQAYGWGAQFGDLDHDRDDDLIMVFGFWSTYPNNGDPLVQTDGVWIQDDDGLFENLAGDPSWAMNDDGVKRGLMLADLNNDGFLDVIKRDLGRPTVSPGAIRYLSRCDETAWLQVELRQEDMNRFAVGARVTAISPDGLEQTRWIQSGSDSMFSGGPPVAHFGLATDAVASLRITWPDGAETEVCEVPTRRTVTIYRGG